MHKVWKLAHQPGGLKSLTDIEFDAYIAWMREAADDPTKDKKARRMSQQSLRAAEAEAMRRYGDSALEVRSSARERAPSVPLRREGSARRTSGTRVNAPSAAC